VGILGAIVFPAASFLSASVADDLHRGTVGPQEIGHDDMWWPKALHCFSKEIQCRFAIPALGDITFKHLTFVIYSAPQVVRFAVDLHENLVQVPLPIRMRTNLLNPFPSDLGRKHRPKPVPPETDRLMTDIDAAFVQQIFDVPERKREPNIHHNRQADDVGRRLEVLEWVTFFHPATLSVPLAHFNQVSADSAPDVIRDAFAGRQPTGLTSEWLVRHSFSAVWHEQREMFRAL